MKTILTILITFVSLSLSAQTVSESDALRDARKSSEERALQIASGFWKNNSRNTRKMMNKQETPRLLLTTNTPTTHEPALYVVGLENGGFVIVNAVEGCGRTVLGYSDAPLPKTEAEYPDAFRYCLGEYARQIECLRQTVSSAGRPSPKGYAQEVQGDVIVAPLLGAKYGNSPLG